MLARVQSYVLQGIHALPCEVEADLDENSLERQTIVGLPDTAVRESLERVRSAITNAGYTPPRGRLVVNLAPAEVRKDRPVYDLPIAVAMLMAQGVIRPAPCHAGYAGMEDDSRMSHTPALAPDRVAMAGELALDGRLRPVRGVLALALLARRNGLGAVIVPRENAAEASLAAGIDVIGASDLAEVVGLLAGALEPSPHPHPDIAAQARAATAPIDFAEVKGQEAVKRALVVAAAGGHNVLMLGPAGTGKTMMARALPGILPPMSPGEVIDVTLIHSAAGLLAGQTDWADDGVDPNVGAVTVRPVRSPHHTASAPAIVGGGATPRPGEISLAHRGVLFLDELPEFPRAVLETLRQPLEDRHVTIARAHGSFRFPASFMLIAAMNPTPGGRDGHNDDPRASERYLSRLSGPLLDRIDLHVEAPAVPWEKLRERPTGLSSAEMRHTVAEARARQTDRQGPRLNAELRGRELDEWAPIDDTARDLLGRAIQELGLSARAYDKLRRLSRTLADLAGREQLIVDDIAEAVQYRLLDRAS